MIKKSSKRTKRASTSSTKTAPAVANVTPSAEEAFANRLQPTLKLTELMNSKELKNARSVHEKLAEQMRATFTLPQMQEFTKSVEAVSERLSQFHRATDLARRAALGPLPASERPAPVLPTEQTHNRKSLVAISFPQDIGQLIRDERRRRKLSQQAFADLVGVGRRFISELENGKNTLEFGKVLQVVSAAGIDLLARQRR